MEAAKSDPAGGYVIMENLKDPRIPSSFVAYRLHNWSGATWRHPGQCIKKIRIEVHTMSNDKIQAVGVNIAEKATMIWNVADMLRGPFSPMNMDL